MSSGEIDGLYICKVDKPPRRSLSVSTRPNKRPRVEVFPVPPTSVLAATVPIGVHSIENVPRYLHNSVLFKSFGELRTLSDNDVVHMKPDLTITCNEDFIHLVKTVHHWELKNIPVELIVYGLSDEADYSEVDSVVASALPYLAALDAIRSKLEPEDRMVVAMATGRVEIVKYLYLNKLGLWSDASGAAAATCGYLGCMEFARTYGCEFGRLTTREAIKNGRKDVLLYLRRHGAVTFRESDMELAAEWNQLECVKYLSCIGTKWGNACRIAARKGHLELFKYITRTISHKYRSKALLSALHCHDMSCVRHLHQSLHCSLDHIDPMPLVLNSSWQGVRYLLTETKCTFSPKVCVLLLHKRQFDLLKLATAAEGDITAEAENCLAQNNHSDEWRLVNDLLAKKACASPTTTTTASAIKSTGKLSRFTRKVPFLVAARHNNVDQMARIHTGGAEWHTDTCTVAAEYGSIEALKYARENGCPWSSEACEAAVEFNQLEILQYLLDNGCPKGSNLMKIAVERTRQDIVTFLLERGLKFDIKKRLEFAKHGKHAGLQFMAENGCVMTTEVCVYAALNGHLPCLELAHKYGGKIDQKVVLGAVQQGQLPCLIFALNNGGAMTKILPAQAIKYKHMHVLKHLHEHNCPIDKKSLAFVHALNQPAVPANNQLPAPIPPLNYAYVVDLT